MVQEGRGEFLDQFPSIAYSHTEFVMGLPHDRRTFERCKLNDEERRTNAHILALHRDLLKLRREDPVFSAQRSDSIHGAVLGPEAFVLRFFGSFHGDRLLLVNLGRELRLRPAPEPLLAPPEGTHWEILWSSDNPRYEKRFVEFEAENSTNLYRKAGTWNIPAHCAVVMYERNSH
jgi:maltooligosyltrehalose trehalohydrolase